MMAAVRLYAGRGVLAIRLSRADHGITKALRILSRSDWLAADRY
eukprot:COSAG01_NODE_9012_length_2583_cov_3.407005_2_plen_44_part_00